MATNTVLEARDLRKAYARGDQKVEALRGVSLSLARGDFASVMGPSGSGKSTFMHLIGALDRPTSGEVLIHGESIASYSDDRLSAFRRRKLGFIFQFFNLLPTLSAIENVAFPLLLDGHPLAEVTPKARELLKMMNLEKRLDHRPDQLSGGEMQRVAIARALVSDPVLLLADEPTGNLDTKTGATVLELLATLARERGHTILMVTHDPKAAGYGNRAIRLRDGLIESDTPVVSPDP